MKVLLLNPPTAAVSSEPLLNIAYLTAVLRKEGHIVKILDATAPYKSFNAKEVDEQIQDFKPDFTGVTLTIQHLTDTYEYLRKLRGNGIPLVVGGPHATALPEEVIRQDAADIVAFGEGEVTILELVDYFNGKKKLGEINGLCFKKDGEIITNTKRELIPDINTIPFPDFDDFPIRNYTGSDDVNSNPIFWSIFSGRGCPHNCSFCASSYVFGRRVRLRTAKNVFEEVQSLVNKYGVKIITFQDDEILCNKKRFYEFCDIIRDSGLKLKWSIRTRIDSIDDQTLRKCLDTGMSRISFGIESTNDETLTKVRKGYTVGKVREQFKIIETAKFPYISFNNIIGFPWEREEHLKKSLEEIRNIPKSINFFTVAVTPIPFPRTDLYEEFHKEYGFTDWWLKPEMHPARTTEKFKTKPVFMLFLSQFYAIYAKDKCGYWNYSKETVRIIDEFCWNVFYEFISRHYNFPQYIFIKTATFLSYKLWKISPSLEKAVFSIIPKGFLRNLQEVINFRTKYEYEHEMECSQDN